MNMIKIDSNYYIKLKDNSLHKADGRKRIKVIQFDNVDRLVEFTAKQMSIRKLEGTTVSLSQYNTEYNNNVTTVHERIEQYRMNLINRGQ